VLMTMKIKKPISKCMMIIQNFVVIHKLLEYITSKKRLNFEALFCWSQI
jgi:hypothetical protein